MMSLVTGSEYLILLAGLGVCIVAAVVATVIHMFKQ